MLCVIYKHILNVYFSNISIAILFHFTEVLSKTNYLNYCQLFILSFEHHSLLPFFPISKHTNSNFMKILGKM